MPARTLILLLIGALLGGCSYFGGGKSAQFDVEQLKRADLQQRAEQGDSEAQYQLGLAYCCGYGPGHTETVARGWFCKAALNGHAGAQFQLGQLYGFRAAKNRPMSMPAYPDYAHLWYSLAAAQGHRLALAYRDALERDMTAQQLSRSQDWSSHPRDAGC